jgi:hypothetical protein
MTITKLWHNDRAEQPTKKKGEGNSLNWGTPYKIKDQKLPRHNPNPADKVELEKDIEPADYDRPYFDDNSVEVHKVRLFWFES